MPKTRAGRSNKDVGKTIDGPLLKLNELSDSREKSIRKIRGACLNLYKMLKTIRIRQQTKAIVSPSLDFS